MQPVTVFLFFLLALVSIPLARGDINAYYGPFESNATVMAPFSTKLGGIASVTVGSWVPRGVRSGLIVPCPGIDAYPDENEDHSNEIVMCAMKAPLQPPLDPTTPLLHLEDILTMVERWGFAAGISVVSNRAGITATRTNGNINSAPRVFVMDIYTEYTKYLYPGLNVSLIFNDDNPYYILSKSPLVWIINTIFAALCFSLAGWACYSFYCWGWRHKWELHPSLISIALIIISNVLRGLNAVNFVDTRLLWAYEFTRATYTSHLVCTLGASFLELMAIHDITYRALKLKTDSATAFLPALRVYFFAGIAALFAMEVITQVLQVVLVPTPMVMTFVTIGFYIVADIATGVYSIYCYRHLIHAMKTMGDTSRSLRRIKMLNRTIWMKPIGHTGWLITLVISLIIGFTMKDTLAYNYTQTAVALVGFSFVLLIDATTLISFGLPVERSDDSTSYTAPRGMSSGRTFKTTSDTRKNTSSKSNSLTDTVKTSYRPGSTFKSSSHSTELVESEVLSSSSSSTSTTK